jgi:hypothetical protein
MGLNYYDELENYYLACVAIAYFGQGDDKAALDVLAKAEPEFREGVARRVVGYASWSQGPGFGYETQASDISI